MTVQYKHATLPNGLRIAAEVMPGAHTAAIGFFVRTGARDELPGVMGVSHFLEHMMFKGSQTLRAEQVDRAFDDLGAEHNAFTSAEMTAFWAHCLPEQLPRAEAILADILRPALRPDDFDDEKKVILEEIAMYDDQPTWVLYERALEAYYGMHPLSHRVLGTNRTITDLTRDQMMAYFTERYAADNAIVALAGNVDFEAMVERIEATCRGWNTSRTKRRYPPVAPAPGEFTIESASVHRHYTIMIAPAPAVEDERRYAASMLTSVLGDSEGSRFYWALVDPGLAEDADASYEARDGLGEFYLSCVCDPADAATIEGIMLEEADKLIGSLTADDLLRVRSRIATGVTLHGELPAGRMRRLGRQLTYLDEYRPLEEELARINAVTLDDLRALWEACPIRPVVTGRLRPA